MRAKFAPSPPDHLCPCVSVHNSAVLRHPVPGAQANIRLTFVSSTEIFDPEENVWRPGPPLGNDRQNPTAATFLGPPRGLRTSSCARFRGFVGECRSVLVVVSVVLPLPSCLSCARDCG